MNLYESGVKSADPYRIKLRSIYKLNLREYYTKVLFKDMQ